MTQDLFSTAQGWGRVFKWLRSIFRKCCPSNIFFSGWPKHCSSMELRPIGRWWSCEGRCEGGPSENCLLKINNMVSIFFAISNHQFSLIFIAGLVQWGFHVQQRQHQLLWVRHIKNSFFPMLKLHHITTNQFFQGRFRNWSLHSSCLGWDWPAWLWNCLL